MAQAGTLVALDMGGWLCKKLLTLSFNLTGFPVFPVFFCSTYASGSPPLLQAAHPTEDGQVPGTESGL